MERRRPTGFGLHDPWPLGYRLAQTDPSLAKRPEIAKNGCAFMCCVYVADAFHRPLIQPRVYVDSSLILQTYDLALEEKAMREDCLVEDWEKVISIAYSGSVDNSPVAYTGKRDTTPALSPREDQIVITRWTHLNYGHFTFEYFSDSASIQYDPLGSAEPGLSLTRKLGKMESTRVFKIIR